MRKSDWNIWIGIAGLFITSIGSTSLLAFKIGKIEKTLEVITTQDLPSMKNDISDLKRVVSEMKSDVTEMNVKVDVLWRMYQVKSTSSPDSSASVSPYRPAAL